MKLTIHTKRTYDDADFSVIRNQSSKYILFGHFTIDNRLIFPPTEFYIPELFEQHFHIKYEFIHELTNYTKSGNMTSLFYRGTFIVSDEDMFYLMFRIK
jgi:hypothetical protein